jgi:hypothetical protein
VALSKIVAIENSVNLEAHLSPSMIQFISIDFETESIGIAIIKNEKINLNFQ